MSSPVADSPPPAEVALRRIGQIAVLVRDADRAVRFYRDRPNARPGSGVVADVSRLIRHHRLPRSARMMPRQLLRVLCLALVVPLIAAACAGHSYGRSHLTASRPMEARPMRGLAMRDPIAHLLDHQGSLRLTPPQVNSLIALDEKLRTDNRPLRERLASLRPARHGHGRMKGGTGGGGGAGVDTVNVAAHMARRDSAAAVMQVMRENKWRATNAAYAQLTEEQMRAAARLEGGGRAGGGPAGRDGAPDRRGSRGMNGPPPSGPGES